MARNPEAKTRIRADDSKLGSDLRRAQGKFGKTFGRIGRGIEKRLGGGLTDGLAGIAAGGGAVLLGRQVVQFEEALSAAGTAANATEAQIAAMRDAINGASRETGIAREQILGGVDVLGDLIGTAAFSEKVVSQLADTMLASGASAEDLANLALVLRNSFDFDLDHLEEGFAKILEIGKEGSVPLRQIGPILQGISAQFVDFGLGGEAGLRQITAAVNVLRDKGFGGAEQAGTGLQALMTALTRNADKLRKAGVRVFERGPKGTKRFRTLAAIMEQMSNSKLLRDPKKLQDALGGRGEAVRAARAYMKNMAEIASLAELGADATSVQSDKMRRLNSDSRKIAIALNNAKMAFIDEFTPERMKNIAELMGRLADVAGVVADNIELIAAAWLAIKFAQGVSAFASMAKSAVEIARSMAAAAAVQGGAGGGAGAAGAGMGFLGKAGALLGSFGLGFGIGTAADQAFGISDKIAGVNTTGRMLETDDTGPNLLFNERLRALAGGTGTERDARSVRRLAAEEGLMNAAGEIDDRAVNRFARANPELGLFTSEITKALARSREVVVHVKIDDQGFARAQQAKAQDARRGPRVGPWEQ